MWEPELVALGNLVHGVDPSPAMLDRARTAWTRSRRRRRTRRHFSIADRRCDAVVAIWLLHLLDYSEPVIAEVARVLRRGALSITTADKSDASRYADGRTLDDFRAQDALTHLAPPATRHGLTLDGATTFPARTPHHRPDPRSTRYSASAVRAAPLGGQSGLGVQLLEQVVGGQFHGLVAPLGRPVAPTRSARSGGSGRKSPSTNAIPGLGLVAGALGQPEVPGAVLRPAVLVQERVLVVRPGLHLTPVAVQHVLPCLRSDACALLATACRR